MSYDRDTETAEPHLIQDADERARKEAENGVRQFRETIKIVSAYIIDPWTKPLKQSHILSLHQVAMHGVHLFAGTFRNSPAKIGSAEHIPPKSTDVAEHMADMCSYVNENWEDQRATHLAAYVLWRLNWIHPFADGNGRTARAVSYLVLSMKMQSILPGTPSIPDQIADDRRPWYYDELANADKSWTLGLLHLSRIENVIEEMLKLQIANGIAAAGM